MNSFSFKEWFYLIEGKFEDQSLAILNKDEDLFKLIATKAPEPKYLPIIAYFYKQSNNLNALKDLVDKYKGFVDNKKLPMMQITNKGAFLNNQEINYIKFAEIIHAAESNNRTFKPTINSNVSGLKPIFVIKDKIEIYKAKDASECVILGKGYPFCISNPNAGLNMWSSYRDSYESTFYFVFEKTRQQTDPLRIVVVDAQADNEFSLTDANNTTGKISEFNSPDEYFGYLHSVYNINSDLIFVNEPMTQQEKMDNNATYEEIYTLSGFKKLTLIQKEKYIGKGHLLTDEQFNYIFDNNMTNLILKYINTGIKLNHYQLEKIFKNESYKKSYLRQRVAVQEHIQKPDIGRFEYMFLDEQSKSKIDLSKINQEEWFLDAVLMGDEKYIKESLSSFKKDSDKPKSLISRITVKAYSQAVKSKNLNIVKIIDEQINVEDPLNNNSIMWIWGDITRHSTVEILKYFVDKYYDANENTHAFNITTGFMNVVNRNEIEMVQYFIDKFKMNELTFAHALFEAAKNNAVESLAIILDSPMLENEHQAIDTAFSFAAENGNLKIAKLILSKRKVNFSSAIHKAIEHNQYQFLEFIFKNRKDFPDKWYADFLKEAIKAKNLPIFKLILKTAPDPKKAFSYGMLDYVEEYRKNNEELYNFIKDMTVKQYLNYGIELANSSDVNSKSELEIKRFFNNVRDNGVYDFEEIKNAAKKSGNMNTYNVLSKVPFLKRNYE